jgi:hypothetical protein
MMKPLRPRGNVFTQHGDENYGGQIRLLEVQCIGSEQGNKVDVNNKRNEWLLQALLSYPKVILPVTSHKEYIYPHDVLAFPLGKEGRFRVRIPSADSSHLHAEPHHEFQIVTSRLESCVNNIAPVSYLFSCNLEIVTAFIRPIM